MNNQNQQQHPSLRVEEWMKRFPSLPVFRLERKKSNLKKFKEKPPSMEDMKDWSEIREGILVDKDTDMPFAILVSLQRTKDERRAIVSMVWKVMQKWRYGGLYFQMGKSNGGRWFKTARKKGVKNFASERAAFRKQAKQVEQLFELAFQPWEGSSGP